MLLRSCLVDGLAALIEMRGVGSSACNFLQRVKLPMLFAVSLAAVCTPSVAQNYKVLQVGTALRVHMRASASETGKVIAYIPPGTIIPAAGSCTPTWCQVSFKNLTGWVFRRY